MWKIVCVVVALAACGPSTQEIKTAKLSTYQASPSQLFVAAAEATQKLYKLGDASVGDCVFTTQRVFYGPTGDLETQGAGDFYHFQPNTVGVVFVVKVVDVEGSDEYAVTVTPDTIQVIEGSPQPRKLAPNDPYLPTFVTGRADALALAIHDHIPAYVAAHPATEDYKHARLRCTMTP